MYLQVFVYRVHAQEINVNMSRSNVICSVIVLLNILDSKSARFEELFVQQLKLASSFCTRPLITCTERLAARLSRLLAHLSLLASQDWLV